MTRSGPPSLVQEDDYDAIAEAVMETARGRWFLSEFARRNRNADTEILLKAIERLQEALVGPREAPAPARADELPGPFRSSLMEMAQAIARTRQEIAAMHTRGGEDSSLVNATEELDAIVEATETATSSILTTAEHVQELAWTMREAGADPAACDALDRHATDIYTACSFQDLTGQRTGKVVTLLRYLEDRVNAMIDIWGIDLDGFADPQAAGDGRPDAHLLNGPALSGHGSSQDEVDQMMHGGPMQEDVVPDDTVHDDIVQAELTHDDSMPDESGTAERLPHIAGPDPFAEIELLDAPIFPETEGLEPETPQALPMTAPAIDPRLAADLDAIGVSHDIEASDIAAGEIEATRIEAFSFEADSIDASPIATNRFENPDIETASFDADRIAPAMQDPAAQGYAAQDAEPQEPSIPGPAVAPAVRAGDAPCDRSDIFTDPRTEEPAPDAWSAGQQPMSAIASMPASPMAAADAPPDIFSPSGAGNEDDGDRELAELAAAIEQRLEAFQNGDAPLVMDGFGGGHGDHDDMTAWHAPDHSVNPPLAMDDAAPGIHGTQAMNGGLDSRMDVDDTDGAPEESMSSMVTRLREVHKMALFS